MTPLQFIASNPYAPWLLLALSSGLAALVVHLLVRGGRASRQLAAVTQALAEVRTRDALKG